MRLSAAILQHPGGRCYTWKAPAAMTATGATFPRGNRIMPDPLVRRFEASATVYFEVEPDGLTLARVVVDVPIPVGAVGAGALPSRFDLDASAPDSTGRIVDVRGFGVRKDQAVTGSTSPARWEVAG